MWSSRIRCFWIFCDYLFFFSDSSGLWFTDYSFVEYQYHLFRTRVCIGIYFRWCCKSCNRMNYPFNPYDGFLLDIFLFKVMFSPELVGILSFVPKRPPKICVNQLLCIPLSRNLKRMYTPFFVCLFQSQ